MSQDLFFIPLNEAFAAVFDRALVLSILSKGAIEPVTNFTAPTGTAATGRL